MFRGNEMVGALVLSKDEQIAIRWAVHPEKDDTPPEVKKHINELYEQAGLSHRKL